MATETTNLKPQTEQLRALHGGELLVLVVAFHRSILIHRNLAT
jgi:hypothetical protein